MFGYILIYKNDKRKYEIGKRYNKYIYYYKELYNIGYFCTKESKIFKIKIFHTIGVRYAEDFKIIKEVNYEEAYKGIYEKIDKGYLLHLFTFLFIKTQNEIFFNELIEARKTHFRNIKELIDKAIISSGNYSYIDRVKNLTKSAKIYLLQEIGRNKDIEKFIKNKDNDILSAIIKIGRHCDLDFFMKNSDDPYLKTQVLKHGRKRDIELYLNDVNEPLFQNIIVLTGIDKYMDYIIKNNFNYFSKVYLLDIGRKKDLDMLVNVEERNFSLEIIDKQYDDHLRLLRHNKNIAVSEKAKKIIDECELN
jgi:hypothetical protein